MLTFLTAWFQSHVRALRQQDPERGASTVELVILVVALVAVAVLIAALITRVVNERSVGIF